MAKLPPRADWVHDPKDSPSTAVTVGARWVAKAGKVVLLADSVPLFHRDLRARRWPDGTVLKLRIEPEAEAYTYADMKHLHGHILKAYCDYTGDSMTEARAFFKALFLPDDGRTSLTQLNREELRLFTDEVEKFMLEECPEAFGFTHDTEGRIE